MNGEKVTPIIELQNLLYCFPFVNIPHQSTFYITYPTNQSTMETILCKNHIEM